MQILTVDVGTGTQDIFLYDSRLDLENGLKLVVPSPTMIVRQQIQAATRRGEAVLLTGVTMGGGPSSWAAEDHLRARLPVYATPEAARSFNDDLQAVAEMGVLVIGEDEAGRLPESVRRLELRDFDFAAIQRALEAFGVRLDRLAVVAVAVFDHGNSPPGYSDRQFRFDYLDERIRSENRLSAFAYRAEETPAIMTRLRAVVQSASGLEAPLVVMDTAPAAVLGALHDPISRFRTLPVLFLSLLSCAAWNLIWICMGHTLGTHWETVEHKMGDFMVRYNVAMIILIVLVILFFVLKKRFRRKAQ